MNLSSREKHHTVALNAPGSSSVGTFGVEGDEAVTEGPFVHRLIEDDVLRENDHGDVLEPAEPLQDLGHGLGLGLFHHAADPHHDLSLRGLREGGWGKRRGQLVSLPLGACEQSAPTSQIFTDIPPTAEFGHLSSLALLSLIVI